VTEISEIALTTEFWFVAVFIGLLINIVSSIIQRIASKGFFRLNKSWDEKNIKSKQTRQFLVDKYSSSYQQLYLGKLEQNAKQMDVINHTTTAAALLLFGMVGPFGDAFTLIALFPAFTALKAGIKHGRFMLIITDAEIELGKQNKQKQLE
jgi:hypothetical protein